MAESSVETKNKLLESAKKEFLEKGFNGASLRTIAANAGVTTGAMYRHFKDKNAFFCALVDDAIEYTKKTVMIAGPESHLELTVPELQKKHLEDEVKSVNDFIDYMFENIDAFTLLLTKAAGSEHENFQEEICELYTKNCQETFKWMYKNKIAAKKVSPMTVHFMASTVINAYCDIILHNMSKKEAVSCIKDIMEFSRYGSMHLLGMADYDV
ncbi:MAG: TetR/AcrR family transcriptional regulator [Treponema sp.]|nr:TetR/AcrR family transcriptional regulator [Treponema sp.]